MGEAQMELGEREFEKIGEYVKSHLPQWIGETEEDRAAALHKRELDILERIVRVEDELKNLREVMEERFSKMDERFAAQQNQMNQRFEAQQNQSDRNFAALQKQMDSRFEAQRELMAEGFKHLEKRISSLQWVISLGFTAIGILMVVLNYLG